MFGFGIGMMLFMFLFWIAYIVLWISTLIDILKSDFRGGSDKIVWLLVVVFVPLLGMILYFAIGKNQKIDKQSGGDSLNNQR
jgi:hypothetical protein